MSNIISYILCFGWLFPFLMSLLGLILGYLLWGRRKATIQTVEAEADGKLRAEATALRRQVQDLEGRLKADTASRDAEITRLKAVKVAPVAAAAVPTAKVADDDETYALEWRNRYLAARVKYLEGRLAEAPKAKAKPAPKKKKPIVRKAVVRKPVVKKAVVKKAVVKKAVVKKKAVAKKAPVKKKAPAKKAAKPKVLYKDGPTAGKPDDLKRIKGIGPKFEKDLHNKGIYYFRQIANWQKKDINMVEKLIDSIPGRIHRDQWVKQAKGFASGVVPKESIMKSTSTASGSKNAKYYNNVKKFDSRADAKVIDKIVKYCGVALRTRDGSLVACSDPAEVSRIAKGFCVKKLGLSASAGEKLTNQICASMKSERFKNRVTFYYLAAKKAGKLSVFK